MFLEDFYMAQRKKYLSYPLETTTFLSVSIKEKKKKSPETVLVILGRLVSLRKREKDFTEIG